LPTDSSPSGIIIRKVFSRSAETDHFVAEAAFNNIFHTVERSAEDEENICRVDLDRLLVRMLASALRRYTCSSSFKNFKERLLHAFTGYVSRNRSIFAISTSSSLLLLIRL